MIRVMLVSGVQQRDSVTHIHLSILFHILFPFRYQSSEKRPLCHAAIFKTDEQGLPCGPVAKIL